MSAAGVRHVHLLVAEHERAIAFYEATRTRNTGSDRRIDLAAPAVVAFATVAGALVVLAAAFSRSQCGGGATGGGGRDEQDADRAGASSPGAASTTSF